MDGIAVVVSLIGSVASWTLSVLGFFFWVAVALLLFRILVHCDKQPSADAVSAVREALRKGELDAEIARVEQRNRNRREAR